MIAWYWLIIAFLLGMVFVVLTDEWFNYENIVFEIVSAITMVVCFIPRVFYCCFIKNVFPGVDIKRFENAKSMMDNSESCFT